MHVIPIYIAVEDELSHWVIQRILASRSAKYEIGAVYSRSGFGYLKKQTPAFNNAAKACPFLVLTDLDQHECPAQLIQEWLKHPRHPNFLLRVAVREVESWLLGDLDNLLRFLRRRRKVTYVNPEALNSPKQELLELAYGSPNRQIREALVWRDEGTGRFLQGPDYNGLLGQFVLNVWSIDAARQTCNSLDRLIKALQRLEIP